MKQKLPVDALLPEISQKLLAATSLILQASPGSGKTTRVPPFLLDEPWAKGKEIWVLVPRRLAAKMAALRVAEERSEDVGGTVGYHFRFERVVGPSTRLRFLTEGMFLRLALQDPEIRNVAAVVLDEFHERHLQTDVALGCLKRLQTTIRRDLKIVVMSATLQAEGLARYLEAPVISLETRLYPVSTTYHPMTASQRLDTAVRSAVGSALAASRGDVLVFLPGVGEILRCQETLRAAFRDELKILPLYADLSREAQADVFRPASKPKVILATNVAETSLTIDGVTTVIDSGLHRRASFSWWSGISRLVTRPISKASAIQRAGRAGRTAPGQCLRLYSQSDFDGRPDHEVPEIERSDLAPTLLEVLGLGGSLADFPWFLPPPPEATEAAGLLLRRIEAVGDDGLTPLGRDLTAFSLHPRLGRAILEAKARGVLEEVATLAAWMSEEVTGDLNLFDVLSRKRPYNVNRLRDQILSNSGNGRIATGIKREEEAARCLLTGFPDRVAKKRGVAKGAEADLVFATGGSAVVTRQSAVDQNEFFLVLDVQERGRQGEGKLKVHVHTLCPIRADWLLDLKNDLIREEESLIWDAERAKVYEAARLTYGDLVLSQTQGEPRDPAAASVLLLKEAFGIDAAHPPEVPDLLKLLERHVDPEPVEAFLARLRLLKSGEATPEFLIRSLAGATSLKDLQPAAFQERMEAAVSPSLRGDLDRSVPTHCFLKGRRVKVHYKWDQKPWIASRLQDFFGMTQGPSLMGGRLPLTLHLLAPNQRPVQVTQDLASFWKNAYPQIRKELGRKYPRHAWPEKPQQK